MTDNILLNVALLLFSGILLGRAVKYLKLPNVTGYLIAGLLLGPSISGLLSQATLDQFSILSDMALAFIAFSIGIEFKASYFKRVGWTPVVIAIFEALGAVILVTLALVCSGQNLAFSLVLGAIAAATAPAATIMVIKQYKAKGPVTETLMSVVALDDAVGLIAFGFAVAIAKVLGNGQGAGIASSILQPFREIGLAVLIGAVLGICFKFPLRFFKKPGNRLILTIGFVFLASSLASLLHASSLLTCMILGAAFTNVSKDAQHIGALCDGVTPPLFLLFFAISGAGLNLSILPSIGLVGVIYVVVRVIGKFLGSFAGAKIMRAPKTVARYLGPTLIPQAGVAIGLTLVAQTVVPEYAPTIRAVVLCGTLIYEIIGPAVTKICLKKAGEITETN